jgi:hypothetical protein
MMNQLRDNFNAIWVGTTAGDMDYYTGATGKARLGIGTAGQVLTVNAGATAPEWKNGGMILIEEKLLTGTVASFDFTSIPQTYRHLKIMLHARSNRATTVKDLLYININGDTGNNYDYRYINTILDADTVLVASLQAQAIILGGYIPDANATAGMAGSAEILIPNYTGTTFRKNIISKSFSEFAQSDPNSDLFLGEIMGHWRNTSAINQITLSLYDGSFIAGSIASLYGMI